MADQDLVTQKKPEPTFSNLNVFLREQWQLTIEEASFKRIDSYDDANFFCRAVNTKGDAGSYLVKVYNGVCTEDMELLEGLGLMLRTITNNVKMPLKVPYPLPLHGATRAGADTAMMDNCLLADGTADAVAVRVFLWIEGDTLSAVGATLPLMLQLGRALGELTASLDGFSHKSLERVHTWDLVQFNRSAHLMEYVNGETKEIIQSVYKAFNEEILPNAHLFSKSVIMADCNDANVIVGKETKKKPIHDHVEVDVARIFASLLPAAVEESNMLLWNNNNNNNNINSEEAGEAEPHQQYVSGIIDFSDAVFTWTVNDIAIAMAYGLLTKYGEEHPLESMAALLAGYCGGRTAAWRHRTTTNDIDATASSPTVFDALTRSAAAAAATATAASISSTSSASTTLTAPRQTVFTEFEVRSLRTLIATRLSISILVGSFSIHKDPENEYLKLHALPARKALKRVWSFTAEEMFELFHDVTMRFKLPHHGHSHTHRK